MCPLFVLTYSRRKPGLSYGSSFKGSIKPLVMELWRTRLQLAVIWFLAVKLLPGPRAVPEVAMLTQKSPSYSFFSRRSFLQASAAATAALPFMTEPLLAAAAAVHRPYGTDGVFIDSNENPLGPSQAAREAIAAIIPQGGRYSDNLTEDLVHAFAQAEALNPDYVHVLTGSTPGLHFGVITFTSPQKSYVTADPGYEAGMFAADRAKARVVKVPLTKTYSHDVKAMISAAPDAGLFYICTPNNPTGTLTPHDDVEYLLENKPKGSVVMVDEAYIHFCNAPSTIDFVKAGKDVILLRTFSKIYGMAGLRCGVAIARPESC